MRLCRYFLPLTPPSSFARRVLGRMLRRCTASTPVSSSFEWHNYVDRSSLFTNSCRRHRDIASAKQKRSAASLNLPEAYFTCEKKSVPRRQMAAGTVSSPRGGRHILSATEVVSASRSMVYITWRSRVFIHIYVPCNHVRRKYRC
jgi:hypothetical protein